MSTVVDYSVEARKNIVFIMDPNSIAVDFLCPLCQTLPGSAVLADDGFIYDKECIAMYIGGRDTADIKSPMTGKPMRATLIISDTIKTTIKELILVDELDARFLGEWSTQKERKRDEEDTTSDIISETKRKAEQGDAKYMSTLGRWYLFGEQSGIEYNAMKGYGWCKQASETGDMIGKAYQGHCLVRGLGVDRDWKDGYELLIEVAVQDDGDGRGEFRTVPIAPGGYLSILSASLFIIYLFQDFAAYTLSHCYQQGIHEFKRDENKAKKWRRKIGSMPDTTSIWVDRESGMGIAKSPPVHSQNDQYNSHLPEDINNTIYPNDTKPKYNVDFDHQSVSTATTSSMTKYPAISSTRLDSDVPFDETALSEDHITKNSTQLDSYAFFKNETRHCERCCEIFALKDLMGAKCIACASDEINRHFSSFRLQE